MKRNTDTEWKKKHIILQSFKNNFFKLVFKPDTQSYENLLSQDYFSKFYSN